MSIERARLVANEALEKHQEEQEQLAQEKLLVEMEEARKRRIEEIRAFLADVVEYIDEFAYQIRTIVKATEVKRSTEPVEVKATPVLELEKAKAEEPKKVAKKPAKTKKGK